MFFTTMIMNKYREFLYETKKKAHKHDNTNRILIMMSTNGLMTGAMVIVQLCNMGKHVHAMSMSQTMCLLREI